MEGSKAVATRECYLRGIALRSSKITLERDLLQTLTIDKGLTFNQIAEKIGVSHNIVRREALQHGFVDPRDKAVRAILDQHSLHKLYIDDAPA